MLCKIYDCNLHDFVFVLQMNTLTSLLNVCHNLPDDKNALATFRAERFKSRTPHGKAIAEVGCQPILHMRHFQVNIPSGLINLSL